MQLPQLRRIRWAVRAALFLGVAASVAANVLHAQPNIISQTISAWPPLALLLTVELTSRIPMHKPLLATVRVLATVVIAGIAAWVSYWHMQSVALTFGETEISSYLLPISVDGLIVVASVSLVELAGRIRVLEDRVARAAEAPPVPVAAPVQFVQPASIPPPPMVPVFQPASTAPSTDQSTPEPTPEAQRTHSPALAEGGSVATVQPVTATAEAAPRVPTSPLSGRPLSQSAPVSPAVVATTRPAAAYANGSTPPGRSSVTRAAVSAPPRTVVTATTAPADSGAPRQRRPAQETAELAEAIEAMHPEISQTELAKQLGISATRLRAVRREAREVRRAGSGRR